MQMAEQQKGKQPGMCCKEREFNSYCEPYVPIIFTQIASTNEYRHAVDMHGHVVGLEQRIENLEKILERIELKVSKR